MFWALTTSAVGEMKRFHLVAQWLLHTLPFSKTQWGIVVGGGKDLGQPLQTLDRINQKAVRQWWRKWAWRVNPRLWGQFCAIASQFGVLLTLNIPQINVYLVEPIRMFKNTIETWRNALLFLEKYKKYSFRAVNIGKSFLSFSLKIIFLFNLS